MAIVERVKQAAKDAVTADPVRPSKDVEERIKRGRRRLEELAPRRNECSEFVRNNHYAHVTTENLLVVQPTQTSVQQGKGKPPHRKRLSTSLVTDVVARKRAAATQRVPSYEIKAATIDPEDQAAATLAQRIAFYGHDRWDVEERTAEVVHHALVMDEGFAWPYWDSTRGRIVDPEQGLCEGEVAVRTFSANQVMWEPGCRFEASPWHAVQYTLPEDKVRQIPGYIPGALKPDASTDITIGRHRKGDKQVLVTEYLERPTAKTPQGMRLKIANDRIVAPRESYPCWEYGTDELALHKLCYWIDPESDRDLGLVMYLLDRQRTFNESVNKTSEWMTLALNPQIVTVNAHEATPQVFTDEPGKRYDFFGSNAKVDWRPVPPVPRELFQIKDEARKDIGMLAASNDIPNQVDTSGGLQALLERDRERDTEFWRQLAKFHSRLMRHCLLLVQKHYTEDRLVQIKGRFGWEFIKDFRGSQLRNQVDVTVMPDSLVPRTRQEIERKVTAFAQMFPGWLTPEAAWSAINGGTAEQLVEDYELDVSRANNCIQLLRGLADGTTAPEQIPQARRYDNHPVQIHVLQTWCKTQDHGLQPMGVQEATQLLIEQHEMLEAQDQARKEAQQAAMAEQLGMANATRGPGKPMPSLSNGASPPGGTPAS